EGDESVVVTLLPDPESYQLGDPHQATLLISDDDTFRAEQRGLDPLTGLPLEQSGHVQVAQALDLDSSPCGCGCLPPTELAYDSGRVDVRPIVQTLFHADPTRAPSRVTLPPTWDRVLPTAQTTRAAA